MNAIEINDVLTAEELKELAVGDEAVVLELIHAEHARVLAEHPHFNEWIEDIDPYVCSRLELVSAMKTGPNIAIRQYLYGVFVFRQNVSLINGRSFP